jgi:hypothetical protein
MQAQVECIDTSVRVCYPFLDETKVQPDTIF